MWNIIFMEYISPENRTRLKIIFKWFLTNISTMAILLSCYIFLSRKSQDWYMFTLSVKPSIRQRNWVFATNSNFKIPIFLQPLIFQTWIIWSKRIYSLKYLRSVTYWLHGKNIKIGKSEFEANSQFLCNIVRKYMFNSCLSVLRYITCMNYFLYILWTLKTSFNISLIDWYFRNQTEILR